MRLIDADALVKEIYGRTMVCNNIVQYANAVTNIIGQAPTIEAEPVRHRRWEECDWVEYDGHSECVRYPKKGRVCTNCRNAFKKELIDNPRVHYCPHCGAKMESGTALSEAEPLAGCVDDADLEHMTRFAMQQAVNRK